MPRYFAICGIALLALFSAASSASADFKLERRLNLPPGGTFYADADGFSVVVTGDSTSGALVTITAGRDDLDKYYDFQFEESAGQARVTARKRDSWRSIFGGNWSGRGPQMTIHLPRATVTDIRTSGGSLNVSGLGRQARVRTSGGSIQIRDIDGDVDGHTSGGSIRAQQIRGGATLNTSGGSIEIADVGGSVQAKTAGGGIRIDRVAGEVQANTSGGSVDVSAAGGRVDAHTSGGSVTVTFSPGANRGGDLSTVGGSVRAEVDPSVALSIDASTSGGGVTSDLPLTTRGYTSRNELRGELNGGGSLLRLHTSGGGIRIAAGSRTSARR